MKKKFLFNLLVVVMLLIATGCGTETETKEPSGDSNVVEKNNNTSIVANITEKVIFDEGNIKITAKSLKYDDLLGPSINLLIENNSDKSVTIQNRDFSINGLMVDTAFSVDVAAGKKANDSISIDETAMEMANITTIKDIEFSILVMDANTWDDLYLKENIKLQTDATTYVQTYDETGFLAVNENDVKIYIKKLEDKNSFLGADIYVYIVNNSQRDVTIQSRDVSINGFMINPIFSADIPAGKKAYDTITFLESDLEANNIENITEMELYFDVFDADSWDDIFESSVVNVKFDN